MKILVLGSTGLLGQALMKGFSNSQYNAFGTIRNLDFTTFLPKVSPKSFIELDNVFELDKLKKVIEDLNIDALINCISISDINNQKECKLNSVFAEFPQNLSNLCKQKNIKLIQISSDGVFSGKSGNYSEQDIPDPIDLYGKAKLKGEVQEENQLTIRVSMIGHDSIKHGGLLEWFINQKTCSLYTDYIFSGLTTNELSRVMKDYILTNTKLSGLYHVAANPISKYDLLSMVSEIYNLKITINKDDSVKMDRSLSQKNFFEDTGYISPSWPELIEKMKRGEY